MYIFALMKLKEFIVESYEVFTRKVHNLENFTFKPSSREVTQIDNFIKLLEVRHNKSSIGRVFLYNFISFSYEYWSGLDHSAKKRIPLNWIIGKKAIDRWITRTEDDLYHSQKYVSDRGIHIGLISSGKKVRSDDALTLRHHEEVEKGRFHNSKIALTNCLETTTLYNNESKLCTSCKYSSQCKVILKKNYPKIYISRGYLKV